MTVNTTANTMRIQVSYSGLGGTTSAAHIHCCTATAATGTAGVATTTPSFAGFPLGVTSGTFDNTLDMTNASSYNPSFITANGGTPATAMAALIAGFDSSKSYFNIHTSTFGGGEIRSFLILVPTAAGVSVSGRVLTPEGRGLRNASVTITDQQGVTRRVITGRNGFYGFDDVEAGMTYVVSAQSRRFQFSPRVIQITDNLTDFDFIASQ